VATAGRPYPHRHGGISKWALRRSRRDGLLADATQVDFFADVFPEGYLDQLPLWAQWANFIATVSIAGFAGLIGYRQWRTAHEQVVLDLFERRMAVYDAAREVVSEVLRDGSANSGSFFKYVRATDRLAMMFGDDVVKYSDKTKDRINRMAYHTSMISVGPQVEEYNTHVQRQTELMTELSKFFEEFSALIVLYVRMTQKLP
jgi:hypothetical protein